VGAKLKISDISKAVGRQVISEGFIARGGKIIDASIVTALIQHNCCKENEAIQHQEMAADWMAVKRAQKDVQARLTKKYYRVLRLQTARQYGSVLGLHPPDRRHARLSQRHHGVRVDAG